MKKQNQKWTREETIIALYMFCIIPFNECRASHPLIIETANLIGRSPAALNMKVGNFGRLDPTLAARGITGLVNGSSLDKIIWDEFHDDYNSLSVKCNQILNSLKNNQQEISLPSGEEVERMVKLRINQDFFRKMVLSAYNNKCCITGISNSKLLEACHISDWSKDEKNRTNPHNGLALTPTLHRAYDAWLLAISPDFTVKVSDSIYDDASMTPSTINFFKEMEGINIILPDKFAPSKELLDAHYQTFLQQYI